MLGLSGGEVVTSSQDSLFGTFDARPVLLDELQCNGNEESIFQCRMTEITASHPGSACEHANDLGVKCL